MVRPSGCSWIKAPILRSSKVKALSLSHSLVRAMAAPVRCVLPVAKQANTASIGMASMMWFTSMVRPIRVPPGLTVMPLGRHSMLAPICFRMVNKCLSPWESLASKFSMWSDVLESKAAATGKAEVLKSPGTVYWKGCKIVFPSKRK